MTEISEFDDLSTLCKSVGECVYEHFNQGDDAHQRFLEEFKVEGESRGYADDATWILTSSFVIFTMQSGFGLLELGSCGKGYQVNIMMKNIIDVIFGATAYYLVGYGISFGRPANSFMGLGNFPAEAQYKPFNLVTSSLLYSKYIFNLSFAATSTTIVSGCVAQRLRFSIYALFSFFAVIFYSFVAHWVFDPEGWLNQRGMHDFAGGAPVHLFGGMNGLIAICFLGPRKGRFDGTKPLTEFLPSSPAEQCLGLFMLWWGWIGFNCGSSFGITDNRWTVAIRCAVTTINSTCGGGLISIMYSLWRTKGKLIIPEHVVNGILGSLVAITPSCACTHSYDAFPIGAVGAIIALGTNTLVCMLRLDDPVGAVGVHLASGIWGLISVGLFSDGELPGITVRSGLIKGGGVELLGKQCIGIMATIAASLTWAVPFFYLIGVAKSRDWKNPRKGLRISAIEEERGADWHVHGVMDEEFVKKQHMLYSQQHDIEASERKREEKSPNVNSRSVLYRRSQLELQLGNGDLNSESENEEEEEQRFAVSNVPNARQLPVPLHRKSQAGSQSIPEESFSISKSSSEGQQESLSSQPKMNRREMLIRKGSVKFR